MNPIKILLFRTKCFLAIFLYFFFKINKNRSALIYEMRQWEKELGTVHYKSDFLCFIRMCAGFYEYRSLLLFRLGNIGMLLRGIVPHQRSTDLFRYRKQLHRKRPDPATWLFFHIVSRVDGRELSGLA